MQPSITSKLPNSGTTIFTIMSNLAAQYDAVNLGQGYPDYPMNEELIDLVTAAMKNGYNQYTHMAGFPLLREVLAEKIKLLYETSVNPDTQITITPGGTYAIYTALTTVLHPGDEVIIFEPAYDCYLPAVTLNGAVPVLISLQHPNYSIDWDEVRKKVTSKTRMIILNTPHNPTGAVLTDQDIDQLRSVVKDTQIIILSDEVYEHLIFENKPHLSMIRYPDLLERSFVCLSFGKVYHCTGWKTGYCVASPVLMAAFRQVHQFNAFTTHTPTQVGLAHYIKKPEHYLTLGTYLQQKRDYFETLMKQTRFKPLPSYGSYFQLYDYSAISKEPDSVLTERLTKEYGVATIPASAFYQNKIDHTVIRFCFAKKEETLQKAVDKLVLL
jgi:methionine transaminase